MTKQDTIQYFKSAPLPEAQTVLEVAAAILDMRGTETPVPAPKRGRPSGSRSKKAAEKPAAASWVAV